MVNFWREYRPQPGLIRGMAAGVLPIAGHLPEAGGYGDQAAIMMDALDAMSAMAAELTRE